MALTVAQAAGVISFVVIILQLTYPLLMVLIMVGLLSDNANAVTWSLVGRFFNGSYWPTILNTDTAMTAHVNRRLVLVPMLSTACLLLLAVAAVITPLGLYDDVTAKDPGNAPFVYVRDTSPIGEATPARDQYNVSRLCGGFAWMSCPGQYHGFYMSQNSTGQYINWENDDSYISSVPPANLSDIFSSGRTGDMALVASPFDLQFRSYGTKMDPQEPTSAVLASQGEGAPPYHIDHGVPRTYGKFRFYESYVLAGDFVVREGIVADMKNGGVGFRNHTLPRDAGKGTRWTEGLLWMEPETVCVANNLSLKTVAPVYSTDQQLNYLVDNGGLTNFTHQYPYIDLNKSQTNPNLWARAHKGAILFNFNLKQAFEINNSTNESYIGREFMLETGFLKPGVISISSFDSPAPPLDLSLNPSSNLSTVEIDLVVQGYGGFDHADDGMIAVGVGAVYSAPVSEDGNPNTPFENGNAFISEIYSCVTAVRAYVMDVTFFINGTASLDNVKVEQAVRRTYDNDSLPLWAMEKTNMNISDVSPLWGMVDDKYETADYLETLRRDYMYVPASSAAMAFGMIGGSDAWGASLPAFVLNTLYGSTGLMSTTTTPDYSGVASYPLSQKWSTLTSSISTIPTMFSLIWSDIMVNAGMGARSQLNWNYVSALNATDRTKETAMTALVQSQSYVRRLGYKLDYAVPGILSVLFYLVVVLLTVVFICTRRTTLSMLRAVLNQTAVGRAVTIERYRTTSSSIRRKEIPAGAVIESTRAMKDDPYYDTSYSYSYNNNNNNTTRVNSDNTDPKTMASKDWVHHYGQHDIGISKWVDSSLPSSSSSSSSFRRKTTTFGSSPSGGGYPGGGKGGVKYQPVITELHVIPKQ